MVAWVSQQIRPLWRGLMGGLMVVLALGLTGCIQYDLDLQFDSQTHGQVVQRLQWQGGAAVESLQAWQRPLRARIQAVGGRLRSPQPDTLELVLPFHSGPDLVQRFNQFLGADLDLPPLTLPTGEPIQGHLDLTQGNWVVAIHNRLSLSLDLRGVPDGSNLPTPRLQAVQWFTGDLTLTTPWGVQTVATDLEPAQGDANPAGNRWSLVPGQVNHLTVKFWVPSPIGMGAIAIVALMTMGYLIKYRLPGGQRVKLQAIEPSES